MHKCGNCLWFRPLELNPQQKIEAARNKRPVVGSCMVAPPVSMLLPTPDGRGMQLSSIRPSVVEADYCEKHRITGTMQ